MRRRTGIPESQLRAAETGQLTGAEGLATLKTVRRYADFLGLPGDRFALAILEDWPTKGGGGLVQAPRAGEMSHLVTGPTASIPALRAPAGPSTAAEGPSGRAGEGQVEETGPAKSPTEPAGSSTDPAGSSTDPAGSSTETAHEPEPAAGAPDGGFPAVGTVPTPTIARVSASPDGDKVSGWTGGAFSDTGMAPAVRVPSTRIVSRRQHVPTLLQAAIVVVSLAVIAGAGILAINRLHPSWLRGISITDASSSVAASATPRAHPTTAGGTTPATSAGATSTGATSTGATSTGAGARRPKGAHGATLTVDKTASSAAIVRAKAPKFVATLRASGGPCWVDVTSPTSSSPIYEGVIGAGTSRNFPASTTLVVEMGSTAGRLTVQSAAGRLGPTSPPSAPYRFTVRPSH